MENASVSDGFERYRVPENENEEGSNECIYLLSVILGELGMCFGKIRFNDETVAALIQKYCGPYGTFKKAQEAMHALSREMQTYLETTYPVPNTGLKANYRYFLCEDTFNDYLGVNWAGDTEGEFEYISTGWEEPYVMISSISRYPLHFT